MPDAVTETEDYSNISTGNTAVMNRTLELLYELEMASRVYRPKKSWSDYETRFISAFNDFCSRSRMESHCNRCLYRGVICFNHDGPNRTLFNGHCPLTYNAFQCINSLHIMEPHNINPSNPSYGVLKMCNQLNEDILILTNVILEKLFDSMPEKAKVKQATLEEDE